jgi:hypothetical protein
MLRHACGYELANDGHESEIDNGTGIEPIFADVIGERGGVEFDLLWHDYRLIGLQRRGRIECGKTRSSASATCWRDHDTTPSIGLKAEKLL